jgi:hAT family C-terminal dimerisation region
LEHFGINNANLGYFILDNAPNNDTTLVELSKALDFDPVQKRLRCMGHILNLIAESYIFGQDVSTFEEDYKKASPGERRKLWRQRGELGKLHNLVAHVTASGKRTDLFTALQAEANVGVARGKRWKLVLDGGIRWNSTYLMIRRALELKEALDIYATKLRVSSDELDAETYKEDYLSPLEWDALQLIKDQLEPLFLITKSLEGNPDLIDGARKASHGALWEILPTFEFLLTHFEGLEKEAKAGKFNDHRGIQSSITLAWNTTKKWYGKTDNSIAWVAGVALHPRFKFNWFDTYWTSHGEARALSTSKTKLRRLWESDYKTDDVVGRAERSPEPPEEISYLEGILNAQAPSSTSRATRPTSRKDELHLYLAEPPTDLLGALEYWKAREAEWPHLASMAFDFLSIPAMSSECERVFSSCGKQTTPESSRLSGSMLWHSECLKNWQRRGAIKMETFKNGIRLALD